VNAFLVDDIPFCLIILLKRNKIYTSSNTTSLFFINLNNGDYSRPAGHRQVVASDEICVLFHFNVNAFLNLTHYFSRSSLISSSLQLSE
jgi:hypothetical protein